MVIVRPGSSMQKKHRLSQSREYPMTLPDERYRAVMWAERFLQELAHDTKKYPRISKQVRREAYSIGRHFPNTWDMKRAADKAPEVFQEKMEPLTRMLEVYKIEQKEEQNDKTI
jgi:hypothetical protein